MKRLLELDALRGIAAIFVVLFHFTYQTRMTFFFGRLGVELFFIISGFVILMSIENSKSKINFLINRFIRLYPTYWICLTLTFACMIFPLLKFHKIDMTIFYQYLVNLSMFQRIFGVEDIDAPYWTLYIELMFYIFVFLIYIFKLNHKWSVISIFICLLSAVLVFFKINTYQFVPILMYFPLFFIGILYYNIYSQKDKSDIYAFILIIILNLVQFYLSFNIQRDVLKLIELKGTTYAIVEYLVALFLFNSCFILLINNNLGFLVNKITVFLGSVSYPLYLFHMYFSLHFFQPEIFKFFPSVNIWIVYVTDLLILLFVSFIVVKADKIISNKIKSYLLKNKIYAS